jgi:hypothetical protein
MKRRVLSAAAIPSYALPFTPPARFVVSDLHTE